MKYARFQKKRMTIAIIKNEDNLYSGGKKKLYTLNLIIYE